MADFIKVLKNGSEDAPNLLLIGGWESALLIMKPLIEQFKPNFNLFICKSFDLFLDENKSSLKENDDVHIAAANHLMDFIQTNRIGKFESILVHSSLGVITAMILLEKKISLFGSLVIMNGTDHYIENDIQRVFWNQIPSNLRENADEWVYDDNKFKEIAIRITPILRKNSLFNDLLRQYPPNEQSMIILKHLEMIRQRKGLNCDVSSLPVMIIGGELDTFTPRAFLRELNEKFPKSDLIYVPAADFNGPRLIGDYYYKIIKKFFQKYKIM